MQKKYSFTVYLHTNSAVVYRKRITTLC